jgi:hypothetical protein
MAVTDEGIEIDVRAHRAKANVSIVERFELTSKAMHERVVQEEKQFSPMSLTDDGIHARERI